MSFTVSERLKPILTSVIDFVDVEVKPLDHEFLAEINVGDRWQFTQRQTEILESLKARAREKGLWNFFLTEFNGGCGLNTVEYAYIAEVTGQSHLAPEVMNCNAPDSGNMEVLARYGTASQKEQWLKPLLNGEIRSGFAMTEPDVASSDATNISMSAILDGDEWVLNGEKTWCSGSGDPRCKVLICMVRTNSEASKHAQHSQILVPFDSEGLERVRPMHVFRQDDAPHGHYHLRFTDVRVPTSNIILGEGRGFEIAQGRLGPGRVHHCMRAIGVAEKALEYLCRRATTRTAFGKPLAELGSNFDIIANARIDIDMARLLTLQTAHLIDNGEPKIAREWISKIKVFVPNMTLKIIDEAIQIHGAAGVGQDFELADMYMSARTLRLADGPDAVHRRQVARAELKQYY